MSVLAESANNAYIPLTINAGRSAFHINPDHNTHQVRPQKLTDEIPIAPLAFNIAMEDPNYLLVIPPTVGTIQKEEIAVSPDSFVAKYDQMFLDLMDTLPNPVLDKLEILSRQSHWTWEHCLRVGVLTAELHRLYGFNDEMAFARGILHDIGKADESIIKLINVTEGLTEKDFSAMHEHPQRGYELLESVGWIKTGKMIGGHHPYGPDFSKEFSGKTIVKEDILRLADNVCAMCEHRPYKKPEDYPKSDAEAFTMVKKWITTNKFVGDEQIRDAIRIFPVADAWVAGTKVAHTFFQDESPYEPDGIIYNRKLNLITGIKGFSQAEAAQS